MRGIGAGSQGMPPGNAFRFGLIAGELRMAFKAYGVPMPLTAITRDMVQTLIGHGYDQDFSQLLLLQAKAAGIELKSENQTISDGLS